jgi:hypothetical protein
LEDHLVHLFRGGVRTLTGTHGGRAIERKFAYLSPSKEISWSERTTTGPAPADVPGQAALPPQVCSVGGEVIPPETVCRHIRFRVRGTSFSGMEDFVICRVHYYAKTLKEP